jgi:quercetin dioxygenase-like cupin family protein
MMRAEPAEEEESMSTLRAKVRMAILSVAAVGAELVLSSAIPQTAARADSAAATSVAITRKTLQTIAVPDSSYEVMEAEVEIPANTHVPRHTHPGTVVGYVLAGDYSIHLDGQPAKSIAPGNSFVVPSGVIHEESAGTHAAKVLAVFTVEKGKPLSSPAS